MSKLVTHRISEYTGERIKLRRSLPMMESIHRVEQHGWHVTIFDTEGRRALAVDDERTGLSWLPDDSDAAPPDGWQKIVAEQFARPKRG